MTELTLFNLLQSLDGKLVSISERSITVRGIYHHQPAAGMIATITVNPASTAVEWAIASFRPDWIKELIFFSDKDEPPRIVLKGEEDD